MAVEIADMMERFALTNRVAVVVGCGSGIARACARAFAHAGARVAGMDVDREAGQQTVAELVNHGFESEFFYCDCSDPASIEDAFRAASERLGRIDVLLSGPAANVRKHPEDLSYEEFKSCLDVGVVSTFVCAREAGRRMIAQGNGGSIINLSSIAGSAAIGRGSIGYSASKGGINQVTKELAIEWARHGIRVNAIQPCQVRTPGLQAQIEDESYLARQLTSEFMRGLPFGRMAEPEEIATAALFLASDAASMVTGVLFPVDGGNLAMNAGGTLKW